MQYWVIAFFIAILSALGLACFHMLKGGRAGQSSPNRSMARALGFRVGISIVLFLCILLGWKLGYLHPTGVMGRA